MSEATPAPESQELRLLREYLISASRLAARLAWSRGRVTPLVPLDASNVDRLEDDEVERLDAFLYRFNALTALVQDHVVRALLTAEEEDLSDTSRKDQRMMVEKLGALKPQLNFGSIAELRNRVAHQYPSEPSKQAQILNQAFHRSRDLLEVYIDAMQYADRKFFAGALGLPAIPL